MESLICYYCGEPVHFVGGKVNDYVHVKPLSQLKVSPAEQADVMEANAMFGHGPDRVYSKMHAAAPLRIR